MNPHRIVQLIIGVSLTAVGVYCILSPGITIAAFAWIIGIFMIVHALSHIGVWRERRALGFGEKYELICSILSLIFGVALIASNFFQTMISTFIIYILAAWIAMIGIFRLLTASSLRKLEADTSVRINNYHTQMLAGVLLILIAAVIFLKPDIITTMIGVFIGACLVLFGTQQLYIAIRDRQL